MLRFIDTLRQRRAAALAVVNLRILLGFAFVPAGLKKVLGEPFTDPANAGPFHDFLDAFFATGGFYRFVGAVQLASAALLMTQRYALLGALSALPIITAIAVFCWSTAAGVPTLVVTSLLWLATIGLLVWDVRRLVGLAGAARLQAVVEPAADERLWGRCGAAILLYYVAVCLLSGGVYRPRGAELDSPLFYSLPLLVLFPAGAWFIERRARRRLPDQRPPRD